MITLLAKIFISGQPDSDTGRKLYGTLCSIVGIVLNVVLFAGKYFAGYISGSIAIMADAFNNLSDAGSSFITLVGFWFAGKKPDIEHPFGHGRFEYLSGLCVAVLIILMGFQLLQDSVAKILRPEAVDSGNVVLVILIASILVKLYMCFYNRRIGAGIDSAAMKATAADSLSDSIATAAVLVSVLLNRFFGWNLDGIFGLIVAVVILYAGYGVAKDTISPLLGQPPQKEFVDQINEIVMSHDAIIGIHDLIVHDYGPGRVMISLHAEVPGNSNIFVIHDLIDNVEQELNRKLGCESVIHMDPVEVDNRVVDEMRQRILAIVKEIHEDMSIHDFRMVTGDTHTNLIFDVVVPYEIKDEDNIVKEKIRQKISQMNQKYCAVIHVDRSYIQI